MPVDLEGVKQVKVRRRNDYFTKMIKFSIPWELEFILNLKRNNMLRSPLYLYICFIIWSTNQIVFVY